MNKTQEKFLTDEEFETQKDDITAIVSAEMGKRLKKKLLKDTITIPNTKLKLMQRLKKSCV